MTVTRLEEAGDSNFGWPPGGRLVRMTVDMLEQPAIDDAEIAAHVMGAFELVVTDVAFLPVGADEHAAAYRITSDRGDHFLKLRRVALDKARATAELCRFLAGSGPTNVLGPIPGRSGELVTTLQGFVLTLYPFVAGRNGFESPLTESQWIELGRALRAVHDADLPVALHRPIRVEAFAPTFRDRVRARLAARPPVDDVARGLVDLLTDRHEQIETIVRRAEDLSAAARATPSASVLCHSDIHAGNVICAEDASLVVVDWDDPIIGPRERDLMFIGAGVGGAWNRPHESDAFYRGYGATQVDGRLIAYYRYERIAEDLALYSDALLLTGRGGPDRRRSLEAIADAFRPGNVVDMADRFYEGL